MPGSIGHPLVSVVIPTHNRIILLQKAVSSAVAQSYNNWELVVVDDGSTDGTADFIREMRDSRISVLEMPRSGHIGGLRNIGVRAGSGEWIAFLDSDDVWMPNKLELQLAAIAKNNTRWCYGNFELMNESGQTIPAKAGVYKPFSGWIVERLLTTEAAVTMCSVIVQRSLFEEVGGFSVDPGLKFRGDYELALRLARAAEVTALDDVLVRVLEHDARSTNVLKDAHERTAFAYEIFLDSKPPKQLRVLAKKQRASHLFVAAFDHLARGEFGSARRKFARALMAGGGLKNFFASIYNGIKRLARKAR